MTVRPSSLAVGLPSGLPSSVFPSGWPASSLSVMRSATCRAVVSSALPIPGNRARRLTGFSLGGSGISTSPSSPAVASALMFSASATVWASDFCTSRISSVGSGSAALGSTPTAVLTGTGFSSTASGMSSSVNSMSIPSTGGTVGVLRMSALRSRMSSAACTAAVRTMPAYLDFPFIIRGMWRVLLCIYCAWRYSSG